VGECNQWLNGTAYLHRTPAIHGASTPRTGGTAAGQDRGHSSGQKPLRTEGTVEEGEGALYPLQEGPLLDVMRCVPQEVGSGTKDFCGGVQPLQELPRKTQGR